MVSHGIKPLRVVALLVALLIACGVQAFDGEGRFGGIAEGDLLFTIPRQPNDITIATGTAAFAADHVAICHRIGGGDGPLYVIEAVASGVTLTPIDTLLARESQADIAIGRVADLDAASSIASALHLLHRRYDFLYLPDNDDIYCSELVQLSYRRTDGSAVFATVPMSFHDASGQITPGWREYYRRRGAEVPEGAPGTNPTQLATHPAVRLELLP